jgi:hypothetical protein
MIVKAINFSPLMSGARTVSLRCPGCRQQGTFEGLANNDVQLDNQTIAGQRRCPNPTCRSQVFVVLRGGALLASYPAERLDFDATNLPPGIVSAIEEAVTCHAAECYVAAGIMVRKALEELCAERGATGATLKDRLAALAKTVVLPQELLDGLDTLRLLGNDAAHIDSQVFKQVGKEEVEVALEFAKEVLKAVYQYSALLARLNALKQP